MASFVLRDIHGNPINIDDMRNPRIDGDDHKAINDALDLTKMTVEEEKEMERLILANITEEDKNDNIPPPSKKITIKNITDKKKFTDDFLRSIDAIYNRIMANPETSVNDNGFIWQQIVDIIIANGAYKWNNEWADYRGGRDYYYASNTLYFLLLANLYCHLFKYIEYEWLESFLEGFELGTPPITGNFHIDDDLHKRLFSECGISALPVGNIIKRDGILSNTTIKATIEEIRKPMCPHGAQCYRQNNPAHTSEFNHPASMTTGKMKSTRKSNRYNPYTRGGGKTRKRRTRRHTKRIKRKTIKRK
jgi:hypothetical protein